MIAIPVVVGYVMTALSVARALSDVAKVGVQVWQDGSKLYQQAMGLLGKVREGQEISQEELDLIEAESDRLTAIAEAHEAQTPQS